MKKPVFNGVATALIAPYDEQGLDLASAGRLLDRQMEAGVSALVINGTTGEAPTLSVGEREALLEFAVAYTSGRMKIIAGIGGNDTRSAVRYGLAARRIGADGLLLTTPYYNKTNPEGLRRHFLRVADEVDLPLIVYNVPGRTGIGCTPELYASLAEHPRINGVKEASGDISLVSRTIRLCGDRLFIWSGNDDQTLPMMALGARGVISVASNVIPAAMSDLCSSCLSGDFASALTIHREHAALFELLFSEVNPIPVKTALYRMGLCPLSFRQPLWPMDGNKQEKLCDCLKDLGLI